MPTKYKLLPEQPTEEMTMAWCANCHALDLDAYKAMWQAAPEREPLSKEEIIQLLKQRDEEMHIVDFIRYIEKAHGIGGNE